MTAPDPRPLLARALDQVGALVADTPPDALDRPTPCDGWDVRTLVRHLVGVHRRVAHVGAGKGESFNPARGSSFIDASRYFNVFDPLSRVSPTLEVQPGLALDGWKLHAMPLP